jgi:hypothetical protein
LRRLYSGRFDGVSVSPPAPLLRLVEQLGLATAGRRRPASPCSAQVGTGSCSQSCASGFPSEYVCQVAYMDSQLLSPSRHKQQPASGRCHTVSRMKSSSSFTPANDMLRVQCTPTGTHGRMRWIHLACTAQCAHCRPNSLCARESPTCACEQSEMRVSRDCGVFEYV